MPLSESKENKTLKYLIIGLSLIALIILLKEVILSSQGLTPFVKFPVKEIKMDFKFLENPEIQQILPFEELHYSGEQGRENPFDPLK